MTPSPQAVKVLRLTAVVLALAALWLAFRPSTAAVKVQVSPNLVATVTPRVTCSAAEKAELPALCRSTPVTNVTPGATAPVTFTCTTLWQEWVSRAPHRAPSGTTYASLTGARVPDGRIYDEDAALTTANGACLEANVARVRVFWPVVVLVPLALLAAGALRRGAARRQPWSNWPTAAASGPDQST